MGHNMPHIFQNASTKHKKNVFFPKMTFGFEKKEKHDILKATLGSSKNQTF